MRRKKTIQEFIEQASKIHNNKYDYIKSIYYDSITKIEILCKKCNLFFWQKPTNHIDCKQGCPVCWKIKKNTDKFIIDANKIHKNKYNYKNVNYIHSNIDVCIKCNACNLIFNQKPRLHLSGRGCPHCAKKSVSQKLKYTQEEFISKAIIIHKNNYDYSLVKYIGSKDEIIVICNNCNKKFNIIPSNHLRGSGCMRCAATLHKMQQSWLIEINVPDIYWEKIIYINKKQYKLDAFNHNTNTIYEFYGDYWHGNVNVFDQNKKHPTKPGTFGDAYEKTIKRAEIIKNAGYNIIQIWESDWLAQKKVSV